MPRSALLALILLALAVAVGLAWEGDDLPTYIAVRPTAFERPGGAKVGDAYTVDPNLTRAMSAMAAKGYEPSLYADGVLICRRR